MLWLAGGGGSGTKCVIGFPLWHQGMVTVAACRLCSGAWHSAGTTRNVPRIKPMTQLSRIFCTLLRCPAFLQVIVAINIWLKLECPVIFDPHGAVHEINRHGLGQYDGATRPLSNGGEQPVPRQGAAQHVFGQVGRFFYPYTAMAESPFGFGKQGAGRGIVQIDLEAVG